MTLLDEERITEARFNAYYPPDDEDDKDDNGETIASYAWDIEATCEGIRKLESEINDLKGIKEQLTYELCNHPGFDPETFKSEYGMSLQLREIAEKTEPIAWKDLADQLDDQLAKDLWKKAKFNPEALATLKKAHPELCEVAISGKLIREIIQSGSGLPANELGTKLLGYYNERPEYTIAYVKERI